MSASGRRRGHGGVLRVAAAGYRGPTPKRTRGTTRTTPDLPPRDEPRPPAEPPARSARRAPRRIASARPCSSSPAYSPQSKRAAARAAPTRRAAARAPRARGSPSERVARPRRLPRRQRGGRRAVAVGAAHEARKLREAHAFTRLDDPPQRALGERRVGHDVGLREGDARRLQLHDGRVLRDGDVAPADAHKVGPRAHEDNIVGSVFPVLRRGRRQQHRGAAHQLAGTTHELAQATNEKNLEGVKSRGVKISDDASESGARGGGGGGASQSTRGGGGARARRLRRRNAAHGPLLDEISAGAPRQHLGALDRAEAARAGGSGLPMSESARAVAARARARGRSAGSLRARAPKKNERLACALARGADDADTPRSARLLEALNVKTDGLTDKDAVFARGMGEVQPRCCEEEGARARAPASRGSCLRFTTRRPTSGGAGARTRATRRSATRGMAAAAPAPGLLADTYIWQVAAGREHTLFLTEAGDVLAVGSRDVAGSWVSCSKALRRRRLRPKKVRGFAGRRDMCECGKRDQRCCRRGWWSLDVGRGDLGHGLTNLDEPMQKNKPAQIKSLKSQRMCLVSVGGMHTLATTHSGKLYAWGRGYDGVSASVMAGHVCYVDTPTHVTALTGKAVVLISAGETHSVLLTEAGVYTMGDGRYGATGGHGDEENKCTGRTVRELSPLTEEEVEALTVKELKVELELRGLDTGGVKAVLAAWLRAAVGSLAHGPVIEVAAGRHHTLARTEDGSVFSWGSGADRQLAHGDEEDRLVPTRVDPAIFADPQLNDAQTIDGEAA